MTDPIPKATFEPSDTDQVIKHFGKSIGAERKQSLMAKLDRERDRFIQAEQANSEDKSPDKGPER